MADYSQDVITRFWSKVDRSAGPDACWLWLGARKKAGYGNFFVRRDLPGQRGHAIFMNAHKFAYTIAYGPIPDGEVVRHRCDVPACCNPMHLLAGTQQNNIADAIERGRFDPSEQGRRGAMLGALVNARRLAYLSDAAVIDIVIQRAHGRRVRELTLAHNVDRTLIFNILEGRTYRWIPVVRRIHELRTQGIRFPVLTKSYTIDLLHPLLRAAIEEARCGL